MKKLFLSVLCLAQFAVAGGHTVGSGGDSLAIEIQNTAKSLFSNWVKASDECQKEARINAHDLYKIVVSATIETTDEALYLEEDGKPVLKEAINYPAENLIIFNRKAFQDSKTKEQFIVHEFLGLAGIPDPNYLVSHAAWDVMMSNQCNQNYSSIYNPLPAPSNLKSAVYASVQVDDNGIVYILDKSKNRILRYSLTEKIFLTELAPKYRARSLVYAKKMKKLFVNTADKALTYFNISDPSKEKIFLRMNENISDFVVANDSVVIAVGDHFYIYNANAQLTDDSERSGDSFYKPIKFYYSEDTQFVYFMSEGISPRDLYRLKVSGGKFAKFSDRGFSIPTQETPYHGDYRFDGLILENKDYIVVGSNLLFKTKDMTFVQGVYNDFDAGAWSSKKLVIGVPMGIDYELVTFNRKMEEQDDIIKVSGEVLSIFVHKDQTYYAYVPTGTTKIEFSQIP